MNQSNGNVYINNTQFWLLLTCMLWPTIIGYGGGIMARQASRNMWLSGILSVVATILVALLIIHLDRKFPSKSLVEYCQELFGTFLGKTIGFFVGVYFLLAAAQSVSIYTHHINDFMLPDTPFSVISGIHILVVCYLVWHGPEIIARIGVVGFITGLAFTLLVFVATLQELNLDRVLPLLDVSLLEIGQAGLSGFSFTGQSLLVIAMILPLVKNQEKAAGSTTIGLITGGLFFIFYFISELMVMGPHLTAQMRVACMDLVRAVQITEYLHRLESFMVALWYWSMLVQGGILAYCATLTFRQTIGINRRNIWLVGATGLILMAFTYFLAFNRMIFLNFLENQWPYLSLPAHLGLPLLIMLIALFRKPTTIKQ